MGSSRRNYRRGVFVGAGQGTLINWIEPVPHYRQLLNQQAWVILWGESTTPIAIVDSEAQAARISERLAAFLRQVADEENDGLVFTSG